MFNIKYATLQKNEFSHFHSGKTNRKNLYDWCAENSSIIKLHILHYYLKETKWMVSAMRVKVKEKTSIFFYETLKRHTLDYHYVMILVANAQYL